MRRCNSATSPFESVCENQKNEIDDLHTRLAYVERELDCLNGSLDCRTFLFSIALIISFFV